MNDILIIIPVHNEEKNLEFVIKDLKTYVNNIDILWIDDCSTDSSLEIIQKNKYLYIKNEKNLGYCKTIQKGVKYAYNNNYKMAILFDSDCQHKAKEISKLLSCMEQTKADLVIGSRYMRKARDISIWKKIGIYICKKIVKKKFQKEINDVSSGFQALNRTTMKDIIDIEDVKCLDLNFILLLLRKNRKIVETPVDMQERKNGKTMHKGMLKRLEYVKVLYGECKNVLYKD